jgi:hypothetical protein
VRFQVPDGEVADANKTDFASIHKCFHPPHWLSDWNCEVGPVELIEINVICAEPPKASFCGGNQVVRFEIPGQDFGRQKNARSLPLDGLAGVYLPEPLRLST